MGGVKLEGAAVWALGGSAVLRRDLSGGCGRVNGQGLITYLSPMLLQVQIARRDGALTTPDSAVDDLDGAVHFREEEQTWAAQPQELQKE